MLESHKCSITYGTPGLLEHQLFQRSCYCIPGQVSQSLNIVINIINTVNILIVCYSKSKDSNPVSYRVANLYSSGSPFGIPIASKNVGVFHVGSKLSDVDQLFWCFDCCIFFLCPITVPGSPNRTIVEVPNQVLGRTFNRLFPPQYINQSDLDLKTLLRNLTMKWHCYSSQGL